MPGNEERAPYASRGQGGGPSNLPVLVGLGILLVLAGWCLAEVRGVRKDMAEKIGQLDTKVAALSTKVDSVGRASQPQRGPDPNKVYTIKTAGSPSKGPAEAPVTIAEFSDFQ
jgi:protein-disulfide isomerase